jgi:hypothetical protein
VKLIGNREIKIIAVSPSCDKLMTRNGTAALPGQQICPRHQVASIIKLISCKKNLINLLSIGPCTSYNICITFVLHEIYRLHI